MNAIKKEIVETAQASFVNDAQGKPVNFTGCKMMITKEGGMYSEHVKTTTARAYPGKLQPQR